jgi:hypothetical protein
MSVPAHDQQEAPQSPDNLVQRVVRWLRAGYPEGVPQQDYVALLGILRRTLTPTEVDRVTHELTQQAEAGMAIMTPQLVEQRITEVVRGPAHSDDLVRVSARLAAAGWPLGSPASEDAERSPYDGHGDGRSGDDRGGLVSRVVDWLREGYPTGLPDRDFVALIALLRRRLTDDEVRLVARRLMEDGVLPGDRVDIGSAIAKVTTELPSEQDVARVRDALAQRGWSPDFPA